MITSLCGIKLANTNNFANASVQLNISEGTHIETAIHRVDRGHLSSAYSAQLQCENIHLKEISHHGRIKMCYPICIQSVHEKSRSSKGLDGRVEVV